MTTRPTVSHELALLIQQGRQARGMTRRDLATAANERLQTIADYESRRAVVNPQLVHRLERVLFIHLVGPLAGMPLMRV